MEKVLSRRMAEDDFIIDNVVEKVIRRLRRVWAPLEDAPACPRCE